MNRLLSFVLLIPLLLLYQAGQSQEVIYSPYSKFEIRSGDFSVIGKVGSRLYTYRGSSEGFFLDAYNDSMELMATVVLDFFPKKINETRFIVYPDHFIVLYQALESGKVVQYAAQLDNMARLVKGPVVLSSAKTGIFGQYRDYFSSAVSDDKKGIVVYGAEEKNDAIDFTGIWMDDQLNIQRRVTASFKADNDISNGEGILGNNGVFYLPAYTATGSKSFADQLWLLYIPRDSGRFSAVEYPLNERYVVNTYMKLDNINSRIYLSGFYSSKRSGSYEGMLYSYFDINSNSFENQKTLPFDDGLLGATGERNKKRAFNDYEVKNMIIRKDGGFVLIAENFYVTTRNANPGYGGYYSSSYSSPFMSQNVREYHYGDIAALSYDKEGNREWHAFVRKNQYSQEDGGMFSSFALLNTGGMLGFLFNDFNSNRSRVQLATIDGDGKVNMRSMAAGDRDDPDWLPRSGKQVGAKEMVVPCLYKRQICFAKIVF
jgi:hypothetical protein